MASRGTILMVDEDELPNQVYIDRLRHSGFKVVQCLRADEVTTMIETLQNELVLITLDIMMPPGNYSAEATEGGLSTGVEVYKDIRQRWQSIPIVCLTLRGAFSRSDLNDNDPNLIVAHKLECAPGNLLAKVDQLLTAEHTQ